MKFRVRHMPTQVHRESRTAMRERVDEAEAEAAIAEAHMRELREGREELLIRGQAVVPPLDEALEELELICKGEA